MSTKMIYLKLEGTGKSRVLQWSYDGNRWAKVEPNSPSTEIEPGDEVDWEGDDSISKLKIKFDKGNIIPNKDVRGNDSRTPKGRVKSDAAKGSSDSYTITVKPADGGPTGEYDPDLKVPQGPVD